MKTNQIESKTERFISTNGPLKDIRFSDIFDVEEIQHLQDLFADANGVASLITTPEGKPITKPSNFTRLCSDIIRKTRDGLSNCYKSDAVIGQQNSYGPVVQPCLSCGLWDAGSSITVGGKHIANWLIGQVRNDSVNEQQMIKYADEIGADRADYLEALHKVPVMSAEKFNNVAKLLFAFANEFSEKAYNNLLLKIQIAEKEKANALLRESEERFQSLFNNAPLGYQSLDIDGNFIEVNQHWLDTFGYTREEIIGKWFGDFLTPASKDYFLKQFPVFKAEGKIHIEYEMVHKNGNILFIAMDGKIGHDLNGKFKQTHGILQDITERKRGEEALVRSEQKFRRLHDSMIDGFAYVDMKGFVKDCNESFKQLIGYSEEELSVLNFKDLTPPKWHDYEQNIINNQVLVRGFSDIYEKEYRRKDGSIIPVELHAFLIRNDSGEKVAMWAIVRDISLRKRAEEALRRSEQKWHTLFEILPVGVSILDKKGNISEHNPALGKILQLTDNELQEHNYKNRKYVYSEDGEIKANEFPGDISVKEQKIIRNIEVGLEKEDANTIWTEVSAAPLDLPDTICAVVTVDITKHKQLEQELKRSELLLNSTQKITRVGGWEWDIEKQFMFWTEEMYDLYDFDQDKYIPGTPESFDLHLECFLPEDRPTIKKAISRCIDAGEPYDLEFCLTTFKGRSMWIRMIAKPELKEGKVVRLTGVNMDITERKLFEKELLEREVNYTVLFNTVKQAIYIQNPDSTFINVNQGAVELFGFEKEYFIGKTPEFMSVSGKNDLNQMKEYLRYAYHGQPQKYEFWGKKKNGIVFPSEIWTVKGKYFGKNVLISLAIDQTERKRAEEEIQSKNKELLKVNAEKDKFFSVIAHDLRSPLSGFMGLTELMAENSLKISPEEFQKMAVVMKNSVTNIFRLLGNLLEWSRMQRGLTTFVPELLLLNSVISECMIQIIEDANKKDIKIGFEIPEDLFVRADRNMLESIIRNLTSNAVKFTPRGGRIMVSARINSDELVEISVKDTGIGLNKEMIANLFRLDANTNRKGTEGEYSTGLGLVICKDFIEKHGGKIKIESEEGKGSVFRFTLPSIHQTDDKNEIKRFDPEENT